MYYKTEEQIIATNCKSCYFNSVNIIYSYTLFYKIVYMYKYIHFLFSVEILSK